jgi:PIN domain nuclease of toxin-antitoxin system
LKLLLDTYAALWWLSDDERLGEASIQLIGNASNEALLSAAVVWEVSIKRSLEKLDAPGDFAPTLLSAGAQPLPVTIQHAEAVSGLAWHHRDPFDRLLIAQAQIEEAVVVSNDEALRPYGVPLVW